MKNIEAVVANVNDLQDGEMKQVLVGETEVLLARIKGQFHAVGAHCTHYKAPLAEGVISGDRVICPWHNACFSLVNGNQHEPPGLDSLPYYEVRLDGENIIVIVPDEAPQQRIPAMAAYNPEADSRTFVILGAGAAGSAAVEVLRQAGFQGQIVMVTREDKLPYDRTWLSKDYFIGNVSRDEMPLRSQDFYKNHNIEVLLNKQAVHVIAFEDGSSMFLDGVELHEKDKSVLVNEYLSAADGIYAAGDIARFPDWRTGEADSSPARSDCCLQYGWTKS